MIGKQAKIAHKYYGSDKCYRYQDVYSHIPDSTGVD